MSGSSSTCRRPKPPWTTVRIALAVLLRVCSGPVVTCPVEALGLGGVGDFELALPVKSVQTVSVINDNSLGLELSRLD